jgi:hypothetical protein
LGLKVCQKIPKEKWKYIALTSMLGTFIPAFLFYSANSDISSVSSILNSLTRFKYPNSWSYSLGEFSKASVMGCCHRFDREFIGFNGAINHPEQNYYYSILVIIASTILSMSI